MYSLVPFVGGDKTGALEEGHSLWHSFFPVVVRECELRLFPASLACEIPLEFV